jgi:hypothetical protein
MVSPTVTTDPGDRLVVVLVMVFTVLGVVGVPGWGE